MATEQITIEVDADAAKAYRAASSEDRKKIQALISLRIKEHVTLLEEEIGEAAGARGPAMAAALEALADAGGLATISDPAGWQREQRRERQLPGREA